MVNIYFSKGGRTEANLKGDLMFRYLTDSPYVEFPKGVFIELYNDSLITETTVVSKYARYAEYENTVLFRDSVVVMNIIKHDTLKTEALWWNQDKEEFYTDRPVEIRQPDKTIFGKGMRADQNLNWYDIFQPTGKVLNSAVDE